VSIYAWSMLAFIGPCHGTDENGGTAETRSELKRRPTNHLARETSPYLLMHARNPVDWYPWSPEVFAKAKREGKPIFLSIGYSSCHWCHVMERLVFEDEKIARLLNENFVSVKVDREERPDIDDVYMTALLAYSQAIGSGEGGGWPLSMFLTPDGKPFAGGTYFPPADTEGRMGFPSVLARVSELWRTQRGSVESNAEILATEVRRIMRPGLNLTPVKLDRSLASAAAQALIESRDPQFGGVDFDPGAPNGPKFPVPSKLALLEYEAHHNRNVQSAGVLALTLDHIAAGGIHDHIGGGFHRYSTDRQWRVPHFEKMLYDQAQLAELYADAFARTGKTPYRDIALETFQFVLAEMTDPAGGFLSALDAETDGVEGTYYVWSVQEVDAVLGPDEGKLFRRVYGFDEPKTFERGYVVHRTAPLETIARELQIAPEELETRLAEMRAKLLAKRRQREPVTHDDKIVTAWNGLMIRALARGGAILKQDDYVRAAEKAASFILGRMRNKQGVLLRTYRAGQARIPGYLEDYAYLTDGLLALFETTHVEKWLKAARAVCDEQIRLFWDDDSKGFYFTSRNQEALIARSRNAFDAVLPSANSVSVRNLVRLAALCHDDRYRGLARETLEAFAPAMAKAPRSTPYLALALNEYLEGSSSKGSQSAAEPKSNFDDGDGGGGIVQTSGESPAESAGPRKPAPIVTAKAFLSVDKLPPGGKCRFVVYLKIKEGWHIHTNTVEEEWRIPTELVFQSKLGAKAEGITYSSGKATRLPGSTRPVMIYEKEAVIRGVINVPESTANSDDELRIQVKYQACDQTGNCENPTSCRLRAKMQVAPDPESVKEINQNLFPKSKK